jgi:YNFM family putative membrane transporter
VFPAAACVVMRRWLPDVGAPARSGLRGGGLGAQLRNRQLLRIAAAGGAIFFNFVGVFSYVTFRLERPPFGFGTGTGALIFLLWLLGVIGPWVGKLVDRIGWRNAALAAVGCAMAGVLLSIPAWLPTLALGLALMTVAMFSGATALQLGVTKSAYVDRGAASAVYFSIYYASAALGAYVPGLAWQAWRWNGIVGIGLAATTLAALSLLTATKLQLGCSRSQRLQPD